MTALLPVSVTGDVEWLLNKLENGNWVVTIFNNKGHLKPPHGVLPTDHSQSEKVTLRSGLGVSESSEWITGSPVKWQRADKSSEASLVIPATGIRFIEIAASYGPSRIR